MILLSNWGILLAERDIAKTIRQLIKEEIDSKGHVVVDLSGVKMITSSFADELFAKLVTEIGLEETKKRVSIINYTDTVKVVINNAVANRLAHEKEQKKVIESHSTAVS